MRDSYDVIIIGAGMGGLSCGAWLAYKGMKVIVLEQNVQLGGLCSSYKRNEFNIKNLLLSGHWTRPAVEVVPVTVSGLQAAKMILEEEGVYEPLAELGIRKGVMVN